MIRTATLAARARLAAFAPGKTRARAALPLAVLVALTSQADARARRPASFFGASTVLHPDCNVRMPCDVRITARPGRRSDATPAANGAKTAQPSKREQARRARGKRIERAMPFGKAVRAPVARPLARAITPQPKTRPTVAALAPTAGEFIAAVQLLLTPLHSIAAALDQVTRHVAIEKSAPGKPAPTIAGYLQRALRSSVSLAGVVPALAAKARELQTSCGSRVTSAVRKTYVAGTRRISLHAHGQAVDMAGNPSCMYALLKGWRGGYSIDYARVKHVHISWSGGGREWGARFVHGRPKARRIRYAGVR